MAVEVVAFLSLGIMRLIVDTSVILIKFFAKATRLYNNTFIVKNLRLACQRLDGQWIPSGDWSDIRCHRRDRLVWASNTNFSS